MTPEDIELEHQAEAEGDIRWRMDRGWRIATDIDGTDWWVSTVQCDDPADDPPAMQLTPIESRVWDQLRTGPVALRPKETR